MKLIIGLGNPGKEYEHTRHNAGFLVLDTIQKELGLPIFQKKTKLLSEISEGTFGKEKIILAKPQTFMNESGNAVKALMKYHKIKPEDLWLIYDDVDLIEGTFRVRLSGSAGTHNGMKSVVDHVGNGNFPRFRFGIAKEQMKQDIVKFILTPLKGKAWECFSGPLENMAKIVVFALKEGVGKAMNTYN